MSETLREVRGDAAAPIRTPSALFHAVERRFGGDLSESARALLREILQIAPQKLATELARHYLGLERRLVEAGTTDRESLRDWLRLSADALMVDPDFALVMAPEGRQVRELGLRLIRSLLHRALATLREPDEELVATQTWIGGAVEGSTQMRRLQITHPQPLVDEDWPILLAKLMDRLDDQLVGKLGLEGADRLIEESLKDQSEVFCDLPVYGAVLSLLPSRLLTPERLDALSRDQLITLGRAKAGEVGELVKALTEQGDELKRLREQLRRSRAAISESLQEFKTVLDAVGEAIITYDVGGSVVMANREAERMWGSTSDELFGLTIRDLLADEARGLDHDSLRRSWQGLGDIAGPRIGSEGVRRDGTTFPISLQISQTGGGERLLFTLSAREREPGGTSSEDLRQSHEHYALAVAGGEHGLWDWNLETNTVFYSSHWKEMLGLDDAVEDTPRTWLARIHPEEKEQFHSALRAHLEGRRDRFELEHRVRHADGTYRWMLIRGQAVQDAAGRPVRIAGSQIDLTERKVTDPLTGMPNRVQFMDRVARALERLKRDADYRFAVLFIDLDEFKVINDSLGHVVGDQLLLAIAQRLEACVRTEDMVARMGGDEFTVLLDGITSVEDAKRVADRFQKELKSPFYLRRQEVFTSASVGIALGSADYEEPDDLMRDADTAMYRAKDKGKARYEVFDFQMRDRAVALMQLYTDLRRAVQRDEFELYYQPIVELESGKTHAFEALIRWNHPERGLVAPFAFIDEAEETGLIVPIGRWVLREAGRQMAAWRAAFSDLGGLFVTVNISPKQFASEDLPIHIRAVLDEVRMGRPWLKVEITESTIMENEARAVRVLEALRDLDVAICIDDFGTGYSSLSALHRFPIDMLKVDRSFVGRMDAVTGENIEIVETIIGLAHNLGMEVTAEGVETAAQLQILKGLSCDYWQGYFYTKPVDSTKTMEFLGPAPKSLQRTPRQGTRDSGEARKVRSDSTD